MACNGPTLDWTGPTEKLWILGQPTKRAFELLATDILGGEAVTGL